VDAERLYWDCPSCGSETSDERPRPLGAVAHRYVGATFKSRLPGWHRPITGQRACAHCGRQVAPDRERLCNHCGEPFLAPLSVEERYGPLIAANSRVLIRSYRAKDQAAAAANFRDEAAILAQFGYSPTSQSWAAGQWGCGAFGLAALLAILIVGLLLLLFLVIVKPEGTLTVTYERQALNEPVEQTATKICPQCAETVQAAAKLCRFCRFEFSP